MLVVVVLVVVVLVVVVLTRGSAKTPNLPRGRTVPCSGLHPVFRSFWPKIIKKYFLKLLLSRIGTCTCFIDIYVKKGLLQNATRNQTKFFYDLWPEGLEHRVEPGTWNTKLAT